MATQLRDDKVKEICYNIARNIRRHVMQFLKADAREHFGDDIQATFNFLVEDDPAFKAATGDLFNDMKTPFTRVPIEILVQQMHAALGFPATPLALASWALAHPSLVRLPKVFQYLVNRGQLLLLSLPLGVSRSSALVQYAV